MKTQTVNYLNASERDFSKARIVFDVGLFDQAGRLAYQAMFHAAQALIFERTDRVPKTHKGVNHQFHRLTRDEPGIERAIASDLSKGYMLKETADYETGDEAEVTRQEADDAIRAAERFVSQVRDALSRSAPEGEA